MICSVVIERITAILSAIEEMWGSNSLNWWPEAPWRANWNFDAATGKLVWAAVIPVSRCPPRTESGSSEPSKRASPGLGSNRSICEGPPDWNR